MLRSSFEFDDEDDVIAKLSRPSPPPGEFVEEPELQAVLEEYYQAEYKKRKKTDRDLEALTASLETSEIAPNTFAFAREEDLARLSKLLDSTCLNSPVAANNARATLLAAPFRFHQPAAAEASNNSRCDTEDERVAKRLKRDP